MVLACFGQRSMFDKCRVLLFGLPTDYIIYILGTHPSDIHASDVPRLLGVLKLGSQSGCDCVPILRNSCQVSISVAFGVLEAFERNREPSTASSPNHARTHDKVLAELSWHPG